MKTIISKLNEIKEKLVRPEENYNSFDTKLFNAIIERLEALIKRQFSIDSEYLNRINQFKKESYYSVSDIDLE
jgi:hypothetical protein